LISGGQPARKKSDDYICEVQRATAYTGRSYSADVAVVANVEPSVSLFGVGLVPQPILSSDAGVFKAMPAPATLEY